MLLAITHHHLCVLPAEASTPSSPRNQSPSKDDTREPCLEPLADKDAELLDAVEGQLLDDAELDDEIEAFERSLNADWEVRSAASGYASESLSDGLLAT